MSPNDSEQKRYHATITGNVQGVGFRNFVISSVRSELENVSGWVKNLPDGRVEVLAEGPAEQLERLTDWLEKGPSRADVNEIDADWGEARGDLHGFDVRYEN